MRKINVDYCLSIIVRLLISFFPRLNLCSVPPPCSTLSWFTSEWYAHAYCFPRQSITIAWGKCQKCLLRTGGGYLCALLSNNIKAPGDLLQSSRRIFICMQNSTLKQKSKCSAAERPRARGGYKNKASKGDGYINKSGDQFLLFICSVYEKTLCILWERLLTIPHMGSNDKHNIAFQST